MDESILVKYFDSLFTRAMVARMHGRIGFADAAGGGTVFHVDLPAAKREALAHKLGRATRGG